MHDSAVGLARCEVPVLRIEKLQHGDVVQIRRELDRLQFAQRRRLRVRVVRRAKQKCRVMQKALKHSLRRVQLEMRLLLRNRSDVWMREGMVADFMALGPNAFDEPGIPFRVLADEKKGRGYFQLFQLVEYLGGVRIGRPIVDREREQSWFVAGAADD